ncbi:SUMF1/EgtB/PvdO family nonheme iron enzyme [Nostoc sp. C117]|uniref:SUMF1/EgtB/PvdO family nonheme iron enzyme n=1 Tax=Nostoc sp. C117 TaxID=3349875 RepID=UPI00370DAD77
MNSPLSDELTQELAQQQINRFVGRFEPSYEYLACHCALPLVLTPELVNYIRVQFLLNEEVPWIAEADLLLSNLCRPIGYELYAMTPVVRSNLLAKFQEPAFQQKFGTNRLKSVAQLLMDYVTYLMRTRPHKPDKLQAQQWAAMVYLDEHRTQAEEEIVTALQALVNRGKNGQAELAQLKRIIAEFRPQLSQYDRLRELAEEVGILLKGQIPSNTSQSYNFPDITLQLPQEHYLLFENGNTRIYSCCTDEPWNLQFDAFVISCSPKIGLSGSLSRSLTEYIGEDNDDELRRVIKLVLAEQKRNEITPHLPLIIPLPIQINRLLQPAESEQEHFLIYATVESPKASIENVSVAVESVIALSLERQLQRIVFSLLGTGNNRLSNHEVAQVMLSKLTQLLSELSSNFTVEITIVDQERSTIEIINQAAKNLLEPIFSLIGFEYQTPTVNSRGEIIQQVTKTAQYFTETLSNNVTLEMVSIPGGTFMMGSPPDEAQRYDDESPQHEVTVPSFFMGKYPVTQAQWRAVAALKQVNRELKPDPSNFKGDDLPVEQISWDEAVEFCDRLSKQTQRNYRLPSEAEWEYACRAGTTTPFHFGETITSDLASYNAEVTYGDEAKGKSANQTTPVGTFVPNSFGLYDMHGNVWEWCYDHWHENYQGAPIDGSAWMDIKKQDKNDNQRRLLRGGSWDLTPWYCRSASRIGHDPVSRSYDGGFRVAVSPART